MKIVHIYTDGACSGNPGPGGWGAVLTAPGTNLRKELSGGFRLTTNNRMELYAAIKGLSALRYACEVTLFTDSQYLANAINKNWIDKWRRMGWRNKDGSSRLNADLWKILDKLLAEHTVKFTWLRGHTGHEENERCDALAREQAAKTDLAADLEYERVNEYNLARPDL